MNYLHWEKAFTIMVLTRRLSRSPVTQEAAGANTAAVKQQIPGQGTR
jgi:hypothetical protein